MHPGTEAQARPLAPDAGDEGAAYARALLDRIGAGLAHPDDLADLMQFLHSGSMLHGACLVLFSALSVGMGARAAR